MKRAFSFFALAVVSLLFSIPAHAWNCTQPGQIRVQVPSGTTGSGQGDGSGQVDTVEGLTFECETPNSTPPTSNPSNAASNSSSSSNSSSTSNSVSTSTSHSISSATGGNASATGGKSTSSASVGNVSGGNSNSSISNSGNSSNTNHVTATGGSGGSATQQQSQTLSGSGNSSSTATGNGDNSNDSQTVINNPRQTAAAIAGEVLPTVPCFKGVGVGVQTPGFGASFGGGKIDQNCAELEASRLAPTILARCKVYITNKYVKQAGVTLADCIGPASVPVIIHVADVPPQVTYPTPNITVNVPAPAITVIDTTPLVVPVPSVAAAAKKNAVANHVKTRNPCPPVKLPNGKPGCTTS